MQLGDQDNNYAVLYHTNLHLVLAIMYLKIGINILHKWNVKDMMNTKQTIVMFETFY